jgi:hypothetical protein
MIIPSYICNPLRKKWKFLESKNGFRVKKNSENIWLNKLKLIPLHSHSKNG